ncbi:MAG: hypothetical protein IGS39_23895 [Calothrix sp. C42_A2020_038]|nr:hypothetical protein [Calothrix sp. C42_A2020_038]
MLFDISEIRLHVIGQTVAFAIEHGREWGQLFLNDLSWRGNKAKMAKHAISESVVFGLRKNINNLNFDWHDSNSSGMKSEIAALLYSHVKLASTLFTIYGIDTTRVATHPLVLAAASGVSVTELATQLETSSAPQCIQKALQSISRNKFAEINTVLGAKLIAQFKEQIKEHNNVNYTTLNTCGDSVKAFITAYRSV